MAAKAEKRKSSMGLPMADMKYVPPTDLHVNLKKFGSIDGYEVGDKCKGTFEGVVTSISKNEDSETMTIEITKLNKGGDGYGDGKD